VHDPHAFLQALAIVLSVAAVTTVVFQRLHQPVVLGYVIAGLIVGPHVPIPLVADPGVVHTLSELGVILLMFSLGLEFRLAKLVRLGPTAGVTAVVQSSIMMWLGFVTGRLFGWTWLESLFTGALIAISSTTIIAKAFDEQKIGGRLREIVVGVLIVEDLIAILLMTILTAVASGTGLTAGPLLATVGKLAAFLAALVAVGMLVVPRAVRAIVRIGRSETTLVFAIGVCFSIALLADAFGYSVALGAFIAGSLVAESGQEREVERLVEPVRDVFAAVFFVSVGMQLDPALVAAHWQAIVALTVVVVLGNVFAVTLGAFLSGAGLRVSVQSGMSLAQIGEFSFIIAGLGLSLGATRDFLYPVAIAVSAITTLLTPGLIRASGPAASWLDRALPGPIQTFTALYGNWLDNIRNAPRSRTTAAQVRRLIRLLALDVALLALLIAGTATAMGRITTFAQSRFPIDEDVAYLAVTGMAVVVAMPLCVGVVRVGRRLGTTLAEIALPSPADGGRVDLASAPRRALVVGLQLGIVLLAGAPLLAITQPFLPSVPGAVILVFALGLLGVAFWRSTTNLEGHVRAGAQVIVEALGASARQSSAAAGSRHPLAQVRELLPGLGELAVLRLESTSAANGKTLAELNLRGLTGATVLAITRADGGTAVPSAEDLLREGDVLTLAGTNDAIEAARVLVSPG
jgi:monovalent cation:H+ antiporter-2, CPA2 family